MKLGNLYRLSLSWSTSRGRDTYGYNICRLDVQQGTESPTRYRCNGGGYDMVGTVVGKWIQDNFQERLANCPCEYNFERFPKLRTLYGLHKSPQDDGSIHCSIDGACGIESVMRIANAIGLEFQRTSNRKGQTTGWVVEDTTQRQSDADQEATA